MSAKTYKDKIRERFLNKKRQASISKSPLHRHGIKLNKNYVKEDLEIATILQGRKYYHNQEENDTVQLEQQISFFTSVISDSDPIINSNTNTPSSKNHNASSIKSDDGNQEESPTHMASSYFQIEDPNDVIEKFERKPIELNANGILWQPKQSDFLTDELNDVVHRDIRAEGLYMPERPAISRKTEQIFLNRMHMIEPNRELNKLQNFTGLQVEKVTKIIPIIPVFIPPTDLMHTICSHVLENKIIHIEIREIKFFSHPLFNDEDIAAKLIENLYNEYVARKENKIINKLETKLKILRETVKNTSSIESNELIIKKYKEDIKLYRNHLYREERYNRNLITKILENWKKLKEIRQSQNSNGTTLKLVILKKDTDFEEEIKLWNDRFNRELNEIYNEKYENYYEEKEKLKSLVDKDTDAEDDDEVNKNLENFPKLKKPDLERIRERLNVIFVNSLRHPGEPIIGLELKRIPKVKPSDAKALKRLQIISSSKYFLKIVFDGEDVTTPKQFFLNSDFLVSMTANFTIKLTTLIPERIQLEIYEESMLKVPSKICSMFIPMPDKTETFDDASFHNIEFTAVKTKFQTKLPDMKSINGSVKLRIGWKYAVEEKDSVVHHTHKAMDDNLKSKLRLWYDEGIIDPIDPENRTILETLNSDSKIMKPSGGGTQATTKGEKNNLFRFNEELLAFCSEEEITQNERFRMLQARHEQDMKYKNIKQVPQFDREIEMPEDFRVIEETVGMDPIDVQRHRGKKYLKNVYETITHHIKLIHKDKEECDILIGDEMPTLGSLSLALFEIFGPKRPLKPTRKSQPSRASCRINDINHFNIVVNVERAFGIPIRNEEQAAIPFRKNSTISSTPQSAAFKTMNVRPYVAITYKDKTVRTSTAEGSNPTWNEQLSLTINNKVQQIKSSLSIQIFDELIEDILEDDRSRATDIYQRISSKWIGELRIPISTIFANQRIEGIFEIDIPPFLLGYTKSTLNSGEYLTMPFGNLPDVRGLTHISLFITVEPTFELDKLNMTGLECTELDPLKSHVAQWCYEYKQEFPARPQYPIVSLLNGKRICVTRLIGAIPIPFEKDDNSEFLIRRFVSLIPVFQTLDSCVEIDGIWLTNSQVLNLTCASPKDLGILLVSYYLELDYKAWAILGYGLPNGNSCYVLIKEANNEYSIIDPLTGKKYNSNNTYCPLIKVYCLINQQNVWANIQKENRVYMTQFDVNKSREWRPLFNRTIEAPTELVHDLNFEYVSSFDAAELQKVIEYKIIKKISTWRTHRKTIWNRYMSENLQKILSEMEQHVSFEYDADVLSDRLSLLFASFKVNGFPINLPYTTLSAIVECVKNSGIHSIADERAEFALAVKIVDYPKNVFSVWIFLVSLVPKV